MPVGSTSGGSDSSAAGTSSAHVQLVHAVREDIRYNQCAVVATAGFQFSITFDAGQQEQLQSVLLLAAGQY